MLVAVFASIYPSYIILKNGFPIVEGLNNKVMSAVDEIYPENLEITIKNGKVKTNVTEPYYLTISQNTLDNILNLAEDQNKPMSKLRLLVIDTNGKAEDFERHQSLAMLTGANLVYYSDEKIQITSLNTVPDIVITKEYIVNKIQEWNKNDRVVNFIKVGLYASPAIFGILNMMLYLLEFLSFAFIIWIINKIHSTKLPFKRIFSFSAALYSIPAFILIIINMIPMVNLFYDWIYVAFNALTAAIAYIIILKHKDNLEENL